MYGVTTTTTTVKLGVNMHGELPSKVVAVMRRCEELPVLSLGREMKAHGNLACRFCDMIKRENREIWNR